MEECEFCHLMFPIEELIYLHYENVYVCDACLEKSGIKEDDDFLEFLFSTGQLKPKP